MAIFTMVGGAIAGALFTAGTTAFAIASSIISGALAFGAKLGWSYLNRSKQREYAAVQGEVQFGTKVPVGAMFGTGAVKGHRIYYAKFGRGNAFNSEVWILSNGWCDGLEPYVYFYGEKHALVARPTIGNETQNWDVVGFEDGFNIRFYDGRPGQLADAKLVSDTANLGREWKSTSVCAGMAYVIVERAWDEEKFSRGVPEITWVLRGLRLYDVRKDSTVVGGSGAHRIDNPATWQFSRNPAVQRFNYQLGLKGLRSGRTLIGEGKSIGQLDLGSYIAAMNVCDQLKAGKPTYQSAMYVQGEDDHTEILREWDDAMAGYGLNRRGLSGIVVGAPQIPVMDIGPDDIPIERAQELAFRKSSLDLYNMMSGRFTSPESQWAAEGLKPIVVNAHVSADGRRRQTSNDFLQVTDPDIAQYLLNIRYRQQRKGGAVNLPVSWRVGFAVMEGEWITFRGKTWLVTEWQLDEGFRFTLQLAETGADIYDAGDIEPGPIVIPKPPQINPSQLSTILNFDVDAGLLTGAGGLDVPVLRFTWDPPGDKTITQVRIQYKVDDGNGSDSSTEVYTEAMSEPERGRHVTSKNVASEKVYVARATITTVPDRLKIYTPWRTTATATGRAYADVLAGVIDLEKFAQDVKEMHSWIGSGMRDLHDKIQELATYGIDQDLRNYDDKSILRREVSAQTGAITAAYKEAIIVATGPGSALASRVEELSIDITGKASVDYVDAVTLLINEEVGLQAAALEQIKLVDLPAKASATAFNSLFAQINGGGGVVENLSGVTLKLNETTGNSSFRMSTSYSPPTGWNSRIGMEASINGGGTFRPAGFFLDVTATQARAVLDVDQFVVTNGTVNLRPLVFTGNTLYADQLRVRWASIDDVLVGSAQIANAAITSSKVGRLDVGRLAA